MCLILFGWKATPAFPLVVAANRDEFHARPTDPAGFWRDQPGVLAGRDLECMGTWLGVNRDGRFAAITNFRDMTDPRLEKRSRGLIASRYLEGRSSAKDFVAEIMAEGDDYRGFNLLAADRDEFWWISNRDGTPRRLDPGIYGLSNHLLETPWPKVVKGKERLQRIVEAGTSIQGLLDMVADTTPAPDEELSHESADLDRERRMSAARILSPDYGTRCSTAVALDGKGRLQFAERSYAPDGSRRSTVRYEFNLS